MTLYKINTVAMIPIFASRHFENVNDSVDTAKQNDNAY